MTQANKQPLENPTKLFPLVLTQRLEETKRYYAEVAGFRVVYDLPTYLQVAYGEGDAPELCFMKPDAFPDGVPRPAFEGKGVIVSVPTPNANDKHAEMKKRGARILSGPAVKPWGWCSFFAEDPNGVVLDFFHVDHVPAMK
jgi:catechol 2,3-dioxygenase-like lactoylglutathione lyase family enzyme